MVQNLEKPWALKSEEVLSKLNSSATGLKEPEVELRQQEYGKNELSQKENTNFFMIFISQFKNALVLILIAAAIISFVLGEKTEAIVIIGIILLSSILGFYQEFRAEKALRLLRKYVAYLVKVKRNNEIVEVSSKDLVPGDVVYLKMGDIVPADIRLMEISDFSADESSLTGESKHVQKITDLILTKVEVPQEMANIAFMGSTVVSGWAYGIVISIGRKTFFGKTATLIDQKAPETDFQKNIRKFSNLLLYITVGMTLCVFLINAILGKAFFDSFLFALALAVGITPELLPMIVTIALSNGALRMAKKKVIIKKLISVEDLGNMDTLCADKTGTLTEGKLVLENYFDLNGIKNINLVYDALICNSAKTKKVAKSGTLIDKAIWQSNEAKKYPNNYELLSEQQFDFERRRMSVLVKTSKEKKIIAKGAPESILGVSNYLLIAEKKIKITEKNKTELMSKIKTLESSGNTVILIAEKDWTKEIYAKEDESDLCVTGYLLFYDPPKASAKNALERMKNLGINIKIISGDSPLVTKKICSDVGLVLVDNRIVTGDDLSGMSPEEFELTCDKYNAFSRVTPEQKYNIVKFLNKEGHVVGFLGDGINDVPALKVADVGISVDSASDVAKNASDIILLKHDLHVLIDGVVAGRKTFANIIKYIFNTMSANVGNMITVAASSAFLKFIPLLPSQILMNNFVSDVPMLAISSDNVDEASLHRPRKWNIGIISKFMVVFGIISTVFDLVLILLLLFLLGAGPALFRTAWFVESVISEIIITFAIRTKGWFFKSKPGRWLSILSILSILFVLGITYTSIGAKLFEFVYMPLPVLILIFGVLAFYFVAVEFAKHYFFNKFWS